MTLIATTAYNKKFAKQPIFDFYIPKYGGSASVVGESNDFYLNTHGISVTNLSKSYTSLIDGYFYILNKNNQTIYFDSITLSSAKFRKDPATPNNSLDVKLNTTGTTYSVDNSIRYDNYIVKFRSKEIGNLTLSSKTAYGNGSLYLVNPFQSLKFGATYAVDNVGLLDSQYYGKSSTNQDKMIGTIDFTFNVLCWRENSKLTPIKDTITITINLINTYYEGVNTYWFGY